MSLTSVVGPHDVVAPTRGLPPIPRELLGPVLNLWGAQDPRPHLPQIKVGNRVANIGHIKGNSGRSTMSIVCLQSTFML